MRIRPAIPEKVPWTALVSRLATHDGAIRGARHIAGNLIRFTVATTILATAIAALLTGGAAAIAACLVRRAATGSGGVARTIATGVPTCLVRWAAVGPSGIAWAAAAISATALLTRFATIAVAGNVAFLTADVGGCRKGSVVAAAFRHAFAVAAFLVVVRAALMVRVVAVVAAGRIAFDIAAEFVRADAAVNTEAGSATGRISAHVAAVAVMTDRTFFTTGVAAGSIVRAAGVVDAGFVGVAAFLMLTVAKRAIRGTAGIPGETTAIVLGADVAIRAAVLADQAVAELLNVAAFLADMARAELPLWTAFVAAIEIGIFLRTGSATAALATAALLAFLMGIGDALAVVAHLAAVAIVVLRAAGSFFVAAAFATDLVFIAQRFAGE